MWLSAGLDRRHCVAVGLLLRQGEQQPEIGHGDRQHGRQRGAAQPGGPQIR